MIHVVTYTADRKFLNIVTINCKYSGLKSYDEYHEHLREMYDAYGPLVREQQGPATIVHVFDPADIAHVYKRFLTPHVAPLLQTAAEYKQKNDIPPGLGNRWVHTPQAMFSTTTTLGLVY